MGHHILVAKDLIIGQQPRQTRRGPRKPTLARAIKEARKAGAKIAGATLTTDGVSLQFGESDDNKPTNELDEWLAKHGTH